MGAIQNSINQITHSVTAGVVGVSEVLGKQAQAKESGLLAKEQLHEAKSDLTNLEAEKEAAQKDLESKAAISEALELKKPGGKGNTKEKLNQSRMVALSEKEAAQRAFDSLADRIEAKKAMIERAKLIMKRTRVGE